MTQSNPQVPWTSEQWDRVTQVIQEEANRARVAASFLPLYGPLPPDTDFVRANTVGYGTPDAEDQHGGIGTLPRARITIDDTAVIQLATLQVKVFLRGAQMADPDMTSALQVFRRAANILARLEDAIVFNGQVGANEGPPFETVQGLPGAQLVRGSHSPARCEPNQIWQVLGGQASGGLMGRNFRGGVRMTGDTLVSAVSSAIGDLEGSGQFGPFAVLLDHEFFTAVQTPNDHSLVLPQDRIIPFLGGGQLLRSSTLPPDKGVLVALGGAPVELVVAADMSLQFIQLTNEPRYLFRVRERIALRIKEADAIVTLF